MSDALNDTPPTSFWVIGALLITWNLIGLIFYYGQVTMTPEMLAASLTEAQLDIVNNTPVWATSAYATAVTAGVIAGALLLLRKSLALPFFILSFVGVLIQDFDAFILSDVIGAWGTSALYLPGAVIIICVFEIYYSRSAKAKGWLT
jgi:hypothetical protein